MYRDGPVHFHTHNVRMLVNEQGLSTKAWAIRLIMKVSGTELISSVLLVTKNDFSISNTTCSSDKGGNTY